MFKYIHRNLRRNVQSIASLSLDWRAIAIASYSSFGQFVGGRKHSPAHIIN